jgi:hypothetical protein
MSHFVADQWYYWHDADVLGPFTGKHLAQLAESGQLLRTDTVWKDNIERGVRADAVRNLFPLIVDVAIAEAAAVENAGGRPAELVAKPEMAAEGQTPTATLADAEPRGWYSASATAATTRRAVAGKGAVIVGQDGTTVKYRKKCTECGFEDTSWRSIPITRGTTRSSFHCPKCRRARVVEIHGQVS